MHGYFKDVFYLASRCEKGPVNTLQGGAIEKQISNSCHGGTRVASFTSNSFFCLFVCFFFFFISIFKGCDDVLREKCTFAWRSERGWIIERMITSWKCFFRPRPHVSGDFCIRNFFFMRIQKYLRPHVAYTNLIIYVPRFTL